MTSEERKVLIDDLLCQIERMRSPEGLDQLRDKQCEAMGVFRTAILTCFNAADSHGIPFLDMLKNLLLCCAAKHDQTTQLALYAALEVLGAKLPTDSKPIVRDWGIPQGPKV